MIILTTYQKQLTIIIIITFFSNEHARHFFLGILKTVPFKSQRYPFETDFITTVTNTVRTRIQDRLA